MFFQFVHTLVVFSLSWWHRSSTQWIVQDTNLCFFIRSLGCQNSVRLSIKKLQNRLQMKNSHLLFSQMFGQDFINKICAYTKEFNMKNVIFLTWHFWWLVELPKQLSSGCALMFQISVDFFGTFSVQCRKVKMHQSYTPMLRINVEMNIGEGKLRKTQNNFILGGGDRWWSYSWYIILSAILDGSHYQKSQKWQLQRIEST